MPVSIDRVVIREHRIPSRNAGPYIAAPGPDGALWFCENGASKIGRLDTKTYEFTEFALPTPDAMPIAATPAMNFVNRLCMPSSPAEIENAPLFGAGV